MSYFDFDLGSDDAKTAGVHKVFHKGHLRDDSFPYSILPNLANSLENLRGEQNIFSFFTGGPGLAHCTSYDFFHPTCASISTLILTGYPPLKLHCKPFIAKWMLT